MVEVGDNAPDFELLDTERNMLTGSEHKGKKVVLAFFPAAFTGVCTKEMCTFSDMLSELNNINATVIGISADSPFSNGAFAKQNNISYPLLSDYERTTIKKYGVELENFAGMQGYTSAQRSVFVVNEEGNIAWKWVADNPGQEPDYDAILSAI
mgnify:CR=1 FL=1|tara:strand:+ start:1266 stop:1724 length:459 start_codon:yes stop_codon:yes gene_type:complete